MVWPAETMLVDLMAENVIHKLHATIDGAYRGYDEEDVKQLLRALQNVCELVARFENDPPSTPHNVVHDGSSTPPTRRTPTTPPANGAVGDAGGAVDPEFTNDRSQMSTPPPRPADGAVGEAGGDVGFPSFLSTITPPRRVRRVQI